jgi:hypothetical protein
MSRQAGRGERLQATLVVDGDDGADDAGRDRLGTMAKTLHARDQRLAARDVFKNIVLKSLQAARRSDHGLSG